MYLARRNEHVGLFIRHLFITPMVLGLIVVGGLTWYCLLLAPLYALLTVASYDIGWRLYKSPSIRTGSYLDNPLFVGEVGMGIVLGLLFTIMFGALAVA